MSAGVKTPQEAPHGRGERQAPVGRSGGRLACASSSTQGPQSSSEAPPGTDGNLMRRGHREVSRRSVGSRAPRKGSQFQVGGVRGDLSPNGHHCVPQRRQGTVWQQHIKGQGGAQAIFTGQNLKEAWGDCARRGEDTEGTEAKAPRRRPEVH